MGNFIAGILFVLILGFMFLWGGVMGYNLRDDEYKKEQKETKSKADRVRKVKNVVRNAKISS